MSKSQDKMLIKIVAIVAVFGIAYMLFGGGGQTSTTPTFEIKQPGQAAQPATVVVQAAATPAVSSTGTLNFRLSSSTGATPTGTSSNMLLLEKSYAVMSNGVYDEQATRFKIMKDIQDNGVSSLKYYTGTPKTLTHSSGIWSDTITGKAGDAGIVFTYYDTTPYDMENSSYAKMFTLSKYNSPTGEWFATLNDGRDRWSLYNYGYYNWTDTTQTVKLNYTIGDSASAAANQVATWQTIATTEGQECVDCAIFLMAPDNYTSKFKDLTITARAIKSGTISSVKFTNLPLASIAPDTLSITSQVLPSRPSANDNLRFVGYIPDNFQTLRTSNDKNQLTWTLTSDTYGADVSVTFYVVQNAHALGTSNGAFQSILGFPVQFSNGATTGFNVAP